MAMLEVKDLEVYYGVIQAIKGIDFEKVAGPVPTPMGNLYLMRCKEETQRVVPTDDELRAGLEGEQMERLSQQLISELKRDVVIEYK